MPLKPEAAAQTHLEAFVIIAKITAHAQQQQAGPAGDGVRP